MYISTTQQAPDIVEQRRLECLASLNQTVATDTSVDLLQRLSGKLPFEVSLY